MADSILDLPGVFEAGKNYLLAGATILAWRRNLIADRALPGQGLREILVPGIGRLLEVVAEADGSDAYTVVGKVIKGSEIALTGDISNNVLTLTLTLPTQQVDVCVDGTKVTKFIVAMDSDLPSE